MSASADATSLDSIGSHSSVVSDSNTSGANEPIESGMQLVESDCRLLRVVPNKRVSRDDLFIL